jgi:5-methylcytosine-specific restriction endonuclease McrA
MSNIADKAISLKLNKNWVPVGYDTVQKSIIDLVSGVVEALDIQYILDDDGNPNFDETPFMRPVKWEEWLTLPVRPWDLSIHSCKLNVRVPTVVVAKHYNKVPLKTWKGKPSKDAIYIRDGGVCQYTGEILDKKIATLDHVLPKSRGGSDDWTNLALTSKELNSAKGNRLNSEIGLKLIKQPVKPKPVPVSALIRDARHPDWNLFIQKN